MSNAEPFTVEELDAMRQELAASDSIYLRAEQSDARWIATIAALSARVAKLEAALRFYGEVKSWTDYDDNALSSIEKDGGDKARAALEDPK